MTNEERQATEQARAEHIERLRVAVLFLIPVRKRSAALGVLDALDAATRQDEGIHEYECGFQSGVAKGRAAERAEQRGIMSLTTTDPPREPRLPDGERMLPEDDDRTTH